MIIEKHPLPEDLTPTDAPPSYDTLGPILNGYRDTKPPTPSTATSSTQSPPHRSPPKSPATTTKGKARANWFNFAAHRTSRDVRNTVLGLVRDLVREYHTNSPAPAGILQSCAEACAAHNLGLASILQEKSIEEHTPLYWAIVKRVPDEAIDEDTQIPDLLTALLSHSTPLTRETISDVRVACLVTSDQSLFQRLRMSPEFSKISGRDEMLLGATLPMDDIVVEDMAGDEGAFAVNFEIVQFQKRMMVSKEIVLEFIARSRMWKLEFSIANGSQHADPRPGSWCISLSLLENSPPAWIDSRLLVQEPDTTSPIPSPDTKSPTSPGRSASSPFVFGASRPRTKPTISIRLKSTQQLFAPRPHQAQSKVVVSLEDSLMGSSLQYAGSSYIAADEKLRARLEARLCKPEAECIIC